MDDRARGAAVAEECREGEIARRLGISRKRWRGGCSGWIPSTRTRARPTNWSVIRSFYEAGHMPRSACEVRLRQRPGPRQSQRRDPSRPAIPSVHPERRRAVRSFSTAVWRCRDRSELGLTKPTVASTPEGSEFRRDERSRDATTGTRSSGLTTSGLPVRECARRFGFISLAWHQAIQRGDVVAAPSGRCRSKTLLVVGRRTSRHHLKLRLLAEGLKENRCEQCGITEWQGKPLNMQLHHLNGRRNRQPTRNIVFLCANCHSQTDTYGGRNGHRRPRRSAAKAA